MCTSFELNVVKCSVYFNYTNIGEGRNYLREQNKDSIYGYFTLQCVEAHPTIIFFWGGGPCVPVIYSIHLSNQYLISSENAFNVDFMDTMLQIYLHVVGATSWG